MQQIGVDEVGYGAWAGPLVICALKFIKETDILFFDSKSISERIREELFQVLQTISIYQIGFGSVEEINELGLASAYKKTLLRALNNFDGEVFIDGRKPKYLECTAIIKGDQKMQCISAASIVAKVIRDNMMKDLAMYYPQYGFENNKGYGTKFHIDAIGQHGLSKMHRICYKIDKYAKIDK